MATISSGVNLSSTFYLRNFYKNDQTAFKSSSRKEISSGKLSHEDALALRRAAKALKDFEFTDDELESNLLGSVDAFIKTYNNNLESSGGKNTSDLKRYAKQLKNLSSSHAEELEDIGITINKDGSLKLNENLFKKADVADIKKVFGKDSSYSKQVSSISKRMTDISSDLVLAELTGAGQNVDLKL